MPSNPSETDPLSAARIAEAEELDRSSAEHFAATVGLFDADRARLFRLLQATRNNERAHHAATQKPPEPIGDAEMRELEFGCDVQEREIQSLRAAGVDCATPHRVVTTKQLRRLLEIARENGLANVYYPKAVRAEREAKEQAHADLATARARVAELQALTDAAALLLGRTADSSENYEEKAAAFYTDTGFMAPGKDAPAAMGGQNQEQRRAAWQAWIETEIADWRDRYAALSPKNPRQGAEQVTDADLRKLATEAAMFGRCNGAGLLELFKVVRDATARECIAECEEYTDPVLPSVIVADIRRRFNLTPTPEPRE